MKISKYPRGNSAHARTEYRSVLFCYAINCVSSGSVNLQVSTQRFGTFGTYRVEDQRMPRRIIAYDHSLKTRGLR